MGVWLIFLISFGMTFNQGDTFSIDLADFFDGRSTFQNQATFQDQDPGYSRSLFNFFGTHSFT